VSDTNGDTVTPDDDQRGAARRDEQQRHFEAAVDAEEAVIRTALVSVSAEEREALERGEMPESVLIRALQQQIEDGTIEGMEELLDEARPTSPGTPEGGPCAPEP